MKCIAIMLACLTAVAVPAAALDDNELTDETFRGAIKGLKETRATMVGNDIDHDDYARKPGKDVEWIRIPGGKFVLGSELSESDDAQPVPNKVYTIKPFEMSKTLVTVEQFKQCVAEGGIAEPSTGRYCNWGKTDRDRSNDPVNCVTWEQANKCARFLGARLPSEAEYEYVAKSGGQDQFWPWGNSFPYCGYKNNTDGNVVMFGKGASPKSPVSPPSPTKAA